MSGFGDARLPKRFWDKVEYDGATDCWNWKASKIRGYGRFSFEGRDSLSHRVAYLVLVGEIPPPLQIDHLCRNRSCCNPAHFELVTTAENTRRGNANYLGKRTRCANGHEFTVENTKMHTGSDGYTYRRCMPCQRAFNHKWRQSATLTPAQSVDAALAKPPTDATNEVGGHWHDCDGRNCIECQRDQVVGCISCREQCPVHGNEAATGSEGDAPSGGTSKDHRPAFPTGTDAKPPRSER